MRYLPGMLALAVVISLAGCSSSTSGSGAPGGGALPGVTNPAGGAGATTGAAVGPSAASQPAAAGSSHAPQASGGGKLPNLCTLVTAAQLSAAVGGGAKYGKAGAIPGAQIDECHWDGPQIGLDITLWNFGTLASFQTMMSSAASKDAPLVKISGVGQQAIASAAGIIVQVNNSEFVQVEGAPGEIFGKHAADIAVAKLIISKL